MFDHVTIRVSDRTASERFYETVLATLGIEQTHRSEAYTEWRDFSLASADESNKVTRRLHIAFVAPSRAHADEFWRVGTAAGYRDDGASGPRQQYGDDYGAYVLDPERSNALVILRIYGSAQRSGRSAIAFVPLLGWEVWYPPGRLFAGLGWGFAVE